MTPDRSLADLFEAATTVRARAYAPYSAFPVGAAIRTPDGRIFVGCNVENAAYPVGLCAEAAAIAAMVAAGAGAISEILVVGAGHEALAPCGACRQRIREFSRTGTVVHLAGASGAARTMTIDELLPEAFGPEALRDTARSG